MKIVMKIIAGGVALVCLYIMANIVGVIQTPATDLMLQYQKYCIADSVIMGYNCQIQTEAGMQKGVVWTDVRHPLYNKDHPLIIRKSITEEGSELIERLAIPDKIYRVSPVYQSQQSATFSGFLKWLEQGNES